LERIRSEVLLYDENGSARRGEPIEPLQQHGVQLGLADLDGWIAPDQVEAHRLVDVVGSAHFEIGDLEVARVVGCELSCSLVHVDRDHPCLWSATGQSESDRAGSAAQIEKHSVSRWLGCIGEQELGSGVETTM